MSFTGGPHRSGRIIRLPDPRSDSNPPSQALTDHGRRAPPPRADGSRRLDLPPRRATDVSDAETAHNSPGDRAVHDRLNDTVSVKTYLHNWLAHARSRVRAVTYEGYDPCSGSTPSPTRRARAPRAPPARPTGLYAKLLAPQDQSAALAGAPSSTSTSSSPKHSQQAVRWQLLPANPAAGAQPPRPRRRPE